MTQLLVIIFYLGLLLGLGVFANRFFKGTSKDYMLASNSIGPFLLLMSLFGTTMTAFAMVGATGVTSKNGVGIYGELAGAAGIMHSLCFFLIGIPLWRIGRRLGYRTQIQFLRARFENNFVGFLLFPLLVILIITYLLGGVVGAGAVISKVTEGAFQNIGWFESSNFGVPKQIASAFVCLVVLAYVFFGGMRGTAWANAFQTLIFMVLGLVTFVAIANSMGGTNSIFENLRIASESVPEDKRSMANMKWGVYLTYLLIPISVGMFPHIFQHWLTAKSAKSFKLPIVAHPIFVMIVWAPCVLIGLWANSQITGAGVPPKTHPNDVLATMVSNHTFDLMGGLLTAGILAAIMSSLDSQFLCLGTVFTEDIVRNVSDKEISDRAIVWYARAFVIGIAVATFLLSLVLPKSVFELGVWSFTGFTGLFPIVAVALYWKRATAAGVIGSILVTAISWSVLFWRSDFGSQKGYTFPESGPVVFAPILTVTLLSTIVLLVVSLMTKPPSDKTLSKFFNQS